MLRGTDDISEQIYVLSILQQKFVHDQLKQIGLNEMQARTIHYVNSFPGHIQKDLAAYLGKQDATVTNLLKQMEKMNYLRREIPNNNERQKHLFLTDYGVEKANQIQFVFIELEKKMNSDFIQVDIQSLKSLLKKLSNSMTK